MIHILTLTPEEMLRELSLTEAAIAQTESFLQLMTQRRGELTATLERLTSPEPQPARCVFGPGYVYRGTFYSVINATWLYVALMRKLWADYPDRRQLIANAMAAHGRVRCFVASTRPQLFPGRPAEFAEKHSIGLGDGWFLDTNLNTEAKQTLLHAALEACGLRPGQDVWTYWRFRLIELPSPTNAKEGACT